MLRPSLLPLGALLAALSLPAAAEAASFAAGLPVQSFDLSGSAGFSDEFDDGVFPGAGWTVLCGSGSESGGELSVDATGPGLFCPVDLFVAGVNLSFTSDVVLTADFGLPLPSEGEFIGIQISTLSASDLVSLIVSRVAGSIFVVVSDELGIQGFLEVEPIDLPGTFYTLQIALVTDGGTGNLVPTFGASADGNPLYSETLAALALDPSALGSGEGYGAALVAGKVPEPSLAALLLSGLAALGLRRGRIRA